MGQCRAGDGRQLALTSYVLSVLWVQLLLGASFLLGPTLICLYCRCQPCKPVVPGKSMHVLHACITRGLGQR